VAMSYSSYWSRRKFIQSAFAGTAVASFNSACSSVGQIIDGDNSAMTDRVVIVGGGLSGLAAAREIKKSGIPFRIYEGSRRIGGRCFSLEDFNQAAQTAELGAEWISSNHEFVKNLCKELRIELVQVNESMQNMGFISGKRIYDAKTLPLFFEKINKQFISLREKLNDQQWDALSAEEMLTEFKLISDQPTQQWIRRLIQFEWGCDPHEISALMYFDRFQEQLAGTQKLSNKKFKIRGGTNVLAQALHDRVAGVIPGQLTVFEHKLMEVDRYGDEFELTFQTPAGEITVHTRIVIFALPFSVLRDVRGLDQMGMSELKLKIIRDLGYGRHGKIVSSYSERFWEKKFQMMTGDIDSQWIWESSIAKNGPLSANHGLLTAQLAGHAGQEINTLLNTAMKNDLSRFGISAKKEEQTIAKSWALDQWTKGSVSFYKPAQMLISQNAVSASEMKGKIIFAGEHTSMGFMGTMNGAIESGLRAAFEAKKVQSELTKKLFI